MLFARETIILWHFMLGRRGRGEAEQVQFGVKFNFHLSPDKSWAGNRQEAALYSCGSHCKYLLP